MAKTVKVKITIKKEFSNDLIRRQTLDEHGKMIHNEYNQAWLDIVVGEGGNSIYAELTEDMAFAVASNKVEGGWVMITNEFVDMKSVIPQGSCYLSKKLYRMKDQENQVGMYIDTVFDEEHGLQYVIVNTSTMEKVQGSLMVELKDEVLDLLQLGSNSSYYPKKEA